MGANGAGKCTLLRILSAELAPQAGTVSLAPAGGIAGWLPQEHERMPWEPVARYVGLRTGWVALEADVVVDTSGAMIARFLHVHVVNRCFYASAYDAILKVIARGVAVAGLRVEPAGQHQG